MSAFPEPGAFSDYIIFSVLYIKAKVETGHHERKNCVHFQGFFCSVTLTLTPVHEKHVTTFSFILR